MTIQEQRNLFAARGFLPVDTAAYPLYSRFKKVLSLDGEDACTLVCLEETEKRLADPGLPSVFVFDKK